jgi:hypothetical protein
MIELNNCDLKDWTRELALPDYSSDIIGGVPVGQIASLRAGAMGGGMSVLPCGMYKDYDYNHLEIISADELTDLEESPRIEPSNKLGKPSHLLMNLIERI